MLAALTLMAAPGAAAQTTQDAGATQEACPTSKATLLAYFPFDASGATTEVARGLASEYLSGGGERSASLGRRYHAFSLRVCQTGTSNERVKGVTLGGGRVVIDNEAGAIRLEEEVTAN